MSAKKEDTTATAVSADAALEDDEFEEFPKEGTNAMRRACRMWCSISTTLLLSFKNSILSSAHFGETTLEQLLHCLLYFWELEHASPSVYTAVKLACKLIHGVLPEMAAVQPHV